MQGAQVRSLVQEDPLEKEMATHSNILVCEILWTEEPGVLQSMGSQRVGHDLESKQQQQSVFLIIREGKFNSKNTKISMLNMQG